MKTNTTIKWSTITLALILSIQIASAYEDTRDESSMETKVNMTEKVLKRFDANSDGKISFDEAPEKMQEHFDEHDLDGDGFIAGDEFDTLPKHPPRGNKPKRD